MTAMNGTYHRFPDGFCRDKFWDWSITWYTNDPDFTTCFQATALVWAPCAFLWATLPLETYYVLSHPYRIRTWTWNSLLKMVLSTLLTVLAASDIFAIVYYWNVHGKESIPLSELLAAVVETVTFLLSAAYIFLDRRKARASSGILFVFWLSTLIIGIITFRSNIIRTNNHVAGNNAFFFATQGIGLIFTALQFLFNCIGEHFSDLEVDEKNPCPERNASFLSEITFSWFSPMAYLGWKRSLQESDLWTLLTGDRTKHFVDTLERHWSTEMEMLHRSILDRELFNGSDSTKPIAKLYQPSFLRALLKTYWIPILVTAIMSFTNDLALFITPQGLRLMISFIEDPSEPVWRGYLYAGIMLVGATFQTLMLNNCLFVCYRLGMHVRGSIVTIVYRKSLKLSSFAKRSSNMGELINLMSVDAQRFTEFMAYIHTLWSAPIRMSLAMYFLYDLLGPSVFVGLGTMLVVFVLNALIIGRVKNLQLLQMKEKDGRIKIMSEILNGIKVLKLYAWEESFQQQVTDVRGRELKTLSKAAYLNAVAYFSWILSPSLVALATFATYVLIDEKNILEPEKAFVAITLLNILRVPLSLLPTAITMAIQSWISVKRLNNFLQNQELNPNNVLALPSIDPLSVQVTQGTFSWGDVKEATLKNVNISVKEGQLVAIVGHVGCGKSSLCSALLGLMERKGEVAVKGSVAYVPQQAWIQNLTLRENILFGKGMRKDRYERTLDSCSLRTDLEMLAGGDETEIGERGTNLSGGQRQRVSLARAVYSDADVYILDDPLSAVDAHVGKHIFENVIGPNGILKNKTRILVTHGIGYLPQTDLIIVLNNGTVSESGTYRQLLQNRGAFSDFLRTYLNEDPDSIIEEEENPDAAAVKEELFKQIDLPARLSITSAHNELKQRTISMGSGTSDSDKKIKRLESRISRKSVKKDGSAAVEEIPLTKEAVKGKLVEMEKSETGAVKWNVYQMLAKQMSYRAVLGIALFYGVSYGASVGANFWLSDWAKDSFQPELALDTTQRNFRLGIYALFAGIQGVFVLLSALTLAYGRMRASHLSQESMLHRIMRAPMEFFDSTPLGRIVNRFSKDVDAIDTNIPATLELWLYCFFSVFSTLIVICINTPPFIAVLIPLMVFYYFMQRYFIATSRQLKRLEAVSRSPIFSHFQESLAGSSVIIATKQSPRFVKNNERLVDLNHASYFPNIVSQRWIAVRLEFVGICVTFCTAIFGILGRQYPSIGVDPEQIGLSITYALSLSNTLNWFVRTTSDMESNVVSVERIKEYSEVPNEPAWIDESRRPPANWPTEGLVQFNGYKTRYREGLELVLKGVDAHISAGEKIGIVGRTGAGKSSLTLALFRIIEAAEGSITIDGVNIADLGLHDVRSRITILPQEPVLFSGTLRLNLDPFGKFSDQEVWLALENSHLKVFVSSLPEGLNHVVSDGGENYSVGQRQLICLARALLRKTKILILDEATAAIDLETDDLIQRTISEKFADCTILTIAHRINTIMDSTRIMVLDQGRVKEFASPAKLLSDPSGLFYSLAKTANLLPAAAVPSAL